MLRTRRGKSGFVFRSQGQNQLLHVIAQPVLHGRLHHSGRFQVSGEKLPLGVLTALLGAPFFVWLILRMRRDA